MPGMFVLTRMPIVEIRPMGPVPKWGLCFYLGRGITRVGFNRPLYPAHVDASDSEFGNTYLSGRFPRVMASLLGMLLVLVVVLTALSS